MADEVPGGRIALNAEALADRRAEDERGAVGEQPVQSRQRGGAAGYAPGGSLAGVLVAPVQPVRHKDQARRLEASGNDRPQR